MRSAIEKHGELVSAYLDANADIGREEASALLRVGPTRASQVLATLVRNGLLSRVGPTRGRLVRFRRA